MNKVLIMKVAHNLFKTEYVNKTSKNWSNSLKKVWNVAKNTEIFNGNRTDDYVVSTTTNKVKNFAKKQYFKKQNSNSKKLKDVKFIVRETAKAICFKSFQGFDFWLPKSTLQINGYGEYFTTNWGYEQYLNKLNEKVA